MKYRNEKTYDVAKAKCNDEVTDFEGIAMLPTPRDANLLQWLVNQYGVR